MQFFLQNEIFMILKMFKSTSNSPEQPFELTQKKATETKTPHSRHSYFVTIARHYSGVIIEGL